MVGMNLKLKSRQKLLLVFSFLFLYLLFPFHNVLAIDDNIWFGTTSAEINQVNIGCPVVSGNGVFSQLAEGGEAIMSQQFIRGLCGQLEVDNGSGAMNLKIDGGLKGSLLTIAVGASQTLVEQRPASGVDFIQNKVYALTNFGTVSAQDPQTYYPGAGSDLLRPIQAFWGWSVNFVFSFLILLILAIAFAIIFRQRLGGQADVTIQNSIPNIAMALILVPLSYAISGLFIDAVTLGTNAVHGFILGPGAPGRDVYETRNDDQSCDPYDPNDITSERCDRGLYADDERVNIWNVRGKVSISDEVGNVIGSTVGGANTNDTAVSIIVGIFNVITGIINIIAGGNVNQYAWIGTIFGLPNIPTFKITFDDHIKPLMEMISGKESHHFQQALSFMVHSVNMDVGEVKKLIGTDTKSFKDKIEKEDLNVLTYLQMKALNTPDFIDLNAHTFTIPSSVIDISRVPGRTPRAVPVPPLYSIGRPYTSNQEMYQVLQKNITLYSRYEKAQTPEAKRAVLLSLNDFECALFCLFNQEDLNIKAIAPYTPRATPRDKEVLQYKKPDTFRLINKDYKGPEKPADLSADVFLTSDKRKKMGSANLLDTYRTEVYSLLGLPAFATSNEIIAASDKLNKIVEAGDQIMTVERKRIKPGIEDLEKIIDRMFEGSKGSMLGAVSRDFFEWLYSLTPERVNEIELGNFHEIWVPKGFSKLLSALSEACKATGKNLRDIIGGSYKINGVTIEPLHFDLITLKAIDEDRFWENMYRYKLDMRSVRAFLSNPELLRSHNKNLAGVIRRDISISNLEIEHPKYGSNTPVYLIDTPNPLEEKGSIDEIMNYVGVVDKKIGALESGILDTKTDPLGKSLGTALVNGLHMNMFTFRNSVGDGLSMLVDNNPEISEMVLYLHKLCKAEGMNWANFAAFMGNPVNDTKILDMLGINTQDASYDISMMRRIRNGFNNINASKPRNGFLNDILENPGFDAFELLSLFLATFNVVGRASRAEIPSFAEIIEDFRQSAEVWASAADTERFLKSIYQRRTAAGRELSHKEQSPIVQTRNALNAFKKDGVIDQAETESVLAQRYYRIESERKATNPVPTWDDNQLINIATLMLGGRGDISIRQGDKAEMFQST